MTEIKTAITVLKRLSGSLLLLKIAEAVIPRLVRNGHMTASAAEKILAQVPELRAEISREIEAVREAMELIQDRVESIAQFLLLHRTHLEANEESEVQRLLQEVRGAAA